jgi:hypothetical protein
MNVLEMVEVKLGDLANGYDYVQMAVDEVEQCILNYCNIRTVPKELNFMWVNMCVDLIKYNIESQRDTSGEEVSMDNVSSLKIGDTQVSLGEGGSGSARATTLKSHRPNLDQFLMNYRQQLKSFRRLRT